jgi:hypothetical protein
MKNGEMGTELINQLTLEERDLLSQLSREIRELKEEYLDLRNSQIEVVKANSVAIIFFFQEIFICSNAVPVM